VSRGAARLEVQPGDGAETRAGPGSRPSRTGAGRDPVSRTVAGARMDPVTELRASSKMV